MIYMWDNLFRKDKKRRELRDLLAGNFIFEDLSGRELSFIETLVHIRKYRPGEHIFKQGEVGVGMYIVIIGNVDITLEDDSIDATSDGAIYVTRLGHGDFFGEISLIEEGGRRTANAIAHNEVTLLGFFKPDLAELIDRNPVTGIKVIKKLSQVLGRRLRETSNKITNLKKEIEKN